MLFRLKNQPDKDRIYANQVIFGKTVTSKSFTEARIIMTYVSVAYEVATEEVIKRALKDGKRVLVPRVEQMESKLIPVEIRNPEKDLIKGRYGIEEPLRDLAKPFDVNAIDLVLVPGLAFDKDSYRLGRGAGYYDRFLASLDARTRTIGLAFNLQIIDHVPRLKHDLAVDSVISN